jgi:hypothetical protein
MHRGATTEALNSGIDGPTIDANNGWRKVEVACRDIQCAKDIPKSFRT